MMKLLAEVNSYGELEICEGCSKPLKTGDLVHKCADGPILCEECAPTFSDIRKQYDEAKTAGDFERMFDFPEDAPDHDSGLDARIAAGDGDKKHVWPL